MDIRPSVGGITIYEAQGAHIEDPQPLRERVCSRVESVAVRLQIVGSWIWIRRVRIHSSDGENLTTADCVAALAVSRRLSSKGRDLDPVESRQRENVGIVIRNSCGAEFPSEASIEEAA